MDAADSDVPVYVTAVLVIAFVFFGGGTIWLLHSFARGKVRFPIWTEEEVEEIQRNLSFAPEGSWVKSHPYVPPAIVGIVCGASVAAYWSLPMGFLFGAIGAAITWGLFAAPVNRYMSWYGKHQALAAALSAVVFGVMWAVFENWMVGVMVGLLVGLSHLYGRRVTVARRGAKRRP